MQNNENKDGLESERRRKLFTDYMMSPEMQEKRLGRLRINDAAERRKDAQGMVWQLCER